MKGKALRSRFSDSRWLLLPLEHAQSDPFVSWVNGHSRSQNIQDLLAKRCVEETKRCIKKSDLEYSFDEFGELQADNLVFHVLSGYLAMPEALFTNKNNKLKIVDRDPANSDAKFGFNKNSSIDRLLAD